MILKFNEQDVTNAVCIATSERDGANIHSVDVDLRFNRDNGEFYAIVSTPVRGSFTMPHQGLIDSIAHYLHSWHIFNPEAMEISMEFTEGVGIEAEVLYTEV